MASTFTAVNLGFGLAEFVREKAFGSDPIRPNYVLSRLFNVKAHCHRESEQYF